MGRTMAKRVTTTEGLAARIEAILNAEIPGTPKLELRKTANKVAAMLNAEIPGTPRVEDLAQRIAALLTTEIPGTPHIGVPGPFSRAGRVQYRRLRGSVKDLSRRAQQVVAALDKHGGVGTSADLQKWLKVNRNVIAGALHELREAELIRADRVEA